MKKKIFVRAPCLSQSGYGEQARFALRALRSKEDIFDIYIEPINWGKTGWIWEQTEFKTWIDNTIRKTTESIQNGTFMPDISLQVTIPNEFQRIAPVNIGYTAGIETNHVAPLWLQKGNEMDKILVVSEHAKQTYEQTVAEARNEQTGETFPYKLERPVEVVHETTGTHEPEPINELKLDTDFNFLIVGQAGPRKNILNAVRWWIEEFIDQEVGLVLKISSINNSIVDYERTKRTVNEIVGAKEYSDRKCKIYLLHGDLSSGQMSWLYQHNKIKALISLSHGEGFGLPIFEAAKNGLPIITTDWSGQRDFLVYPDTGDLFTKVEYSLQKVPPEVHWKDVIEPTALWAYPEQGSYKMSLRRVRKRYKSIKEKALELQKLLNIKFSDEKLYEGFCDAIYKPSTEYLDWMNELDDAEEL